MAEWDHINWMPFVLRIKQEIARWEQTAERETFIADALSKQVEKHQESATYWKRRAKEMRERMERDGV